MPQTPFIGIPSERVAHAHVTIKDQNTISRSYSDAVRSRGGIPLVIPVMDAPERLEGLLDRLDGLLLPGSDDIPPSRYDAVPHSSEKHMPDLQYLLWAELVRQARDRGLPLLGICGGFQVMNVALGGSLIQDIPTQIGRDICHSSGNHTDAVHEIDVMADNRLAEILGGGRRAVNSSHHQAVDRPGQGLCLTARSAVDGIVEAAELPHHPFFVGVQWHPERFFEGESSDRLFRAFLAACVEKTR